MQVLWCARAYRLVGGEDHRHEGLVLGPKRYLDGWCGARTQGFPVIHMTRVQLGFDFQYQYLCLVGLDTTVCASEGT